MIEINLLDLNEPGEVTEDSREEDELFELSKAERFN